MHILLLLFVIIVIAVILVVRGNPSPEQLSRKRWRKVSQEAERLELEVVHLDAQEAERLARELLTGSALGPDLDAGASLTDVVLGQLDQTRLALFECVVPGASSSPGTATVVVVCGMAMPHFCVRPLPGRSGPQPVPCSERGMQRLELPGHDLLNETYLFHVAPEDTQQLQRLVDAGKLLGFFEQRLSRPFHVESTGDRLLLFEQGRVTPVGQLERLLRSAVRLARQLTDPNARLVEPGDEPCAPVEADESGSTTDA